jgi:hypothetical protein
MTWAPMSEESLLALIEDAECAMPPRMLAVWKLLEIRPVKWQLSPWGDTDGGFWVVAVVGQECVWYNDIEDGFDISPFSTFGHIGDYRCSQLDLQHCVYRYFEAFQQAVGGPAAPDRADL